MATYDEEVSTLEKIRIKIRRLTRSPSPTQITDAQLDDYINSFIIYDLPAHVTLSELSTTLVFYAKPNIDTYSTNTTQSLDPLYNFKNKYTAVYGPAYVSGSKIHFTKSREAFYDENPLTNTETQIGTGDGIETDFTGTLSAFPISQNNVTFTAISSVDNEPLTMVDSPQTAMSGNITETTNTTVSGTIDYLTGEYDVTFSAAPELSTAVNIQTVPYVAGLPSTMLYYNNEFVLRPVPDQPYRIELQVQIRPLPLLESSDLPEFARWWQYIAIGGAKKILEDKMDMEGVAMLMPEFKKQETLILRSTLLQQSGERVSTIYSENRRLNDGI